jgi:hypothetical protein
LIDKFHPVSEEFYDMRNLFNTFQTVLNALVVVVVVVVCVSAEALSG